MAEWRHVVSVAGMCGDCYDAMGISDHDAEPPCIDPPIPDPASPCGAFVGRVRCYWNHGIQTSADDEVGHPHQPTRCTCGHSIECVPPEGR